MTDSEEFFDAFETTYEIECEKTQIEMNRANAQLNLLQSEIKPRCVKLDSESESIQHRFSNQVRV